MYTWTSTLSNDNRVWSRLLGAGELAFYYDGEVNGIVDGLHHIHIEINPPELLNEEHFVSTWNRVKCRYPLLATTVEELGDGKAQFVVDEQRLTSILPGEFIFRDLDDSQLPELVEDYNNGARKLSRNLLSSMEILVQHRSALAPACCSIMLAMAHCISDLTGGHSALKTFLEYLVNPSNEANESFRCGERLGMVPASYSHYMHRGWTRAKQRWKMAIAWALLKFRNRNLVVSARPSSDLLPAHYDQGGHTLPTTNLGSNSQLANSKNLYVDLDPCIGKAVLESCRRHGVTFGHTLYVLFQIAHSVVLHRRRHMFSAEEWDHRLKQPMHFAGPVNPRPFLDQDWLKNGGHSEVFAAVAYANVTLPFIPRMKESEMGYGDLMTKAVFWHRCNMVKRQWRNFLKHPLMLQIAAVMEVARASSRRVNLKNWNALQNGEFSGNSLQSALQGDDGVVFANRGSSFGSVRDYLGCFPFLALTLILYLGRNGITPSLPHESQIW